MKNLTSKITVSTKTLELNITGEIYHGWTCDDLKYRIQEGLNNGVENCSLYMNTEGGSVFEASEIVNQLKRIKNVTVYAGALVASAGTYIMCHFKSFGYENSMFMIHKPMSYIQGNIDEIEKEKELLVKLTNMYRQTYSKRFNKSEQEIDELWKSDKWLTSKEAKELNLVNEIISQEVEIDKDLQAKIKACGCPYEVKTNTKKDKIKDMDINLIRSTLGMSADSTEQEVLAKMKELKQEKQQENKSLEELKAKAEEMVNKAIFSHRIPATEKNTYMQLAISDFEKTKTLLDGYTPLEKPTGFAQTPQMKGESEYERDAWSLEDWIAKDTEGFENFVLQNKERGKQLLKEYLFYRFTMDLFKEFELNKENVYKYYFIGKSTTKNIIYRIIEKLGLIRG